tara:strand:+ start:122 stop:529 length:408 start_codon:yes stop_codon:yes gene_type:complete
VPKFTTPNKTQAVQIAVANPNARGLPHTKRQLYFPWKYKNQQRNSLKNLARSFYPLKGITLLTSTNKLFAMPFSAAFEALNLHLCALMDVASFGHAATTNNHRRIFHEWTLPISARASEMTLHPSLRRLTFRAGM